MTQPQQSGNVLPLCSCTWVHFSVRHLLLSMLLLSSVVRAMQGEMVMPGSMALDKDLGGVEQGTYQSKPQESKH